MSLRETWRQMARKPGGASSAEVARALGIAIDKIGSSAWHLKQSGELFSAARSWKDVRYFGTQQEADAWAAAALMDRPTLTIKPVRVAANWKDQEPIIPPGVKVTICPTRWA